MASLKNGLAQVVLEALILVAIVSMQRVVQGMPKSGFSNCFISHKAWSTSRHASNNAQLTAYCV